MVGQGNKNSVKICFSDMIEERMDSIQGMKKMKEREKVDLFSYLFIQTFETPSGVEIKKDI